MEDSCEWFVNDSQGLRNSAEGLSRPDFNKYKFIVLEEVKRYPRGERWAVRGVADDKVGSGVHLQQRRPLVHRRHLNRIKMSALAILTFALGLIGLRPLEAQSSARQTNHFSFGEATVTVKTPER